MSLFPVIGFISIHKTSSCDQNRPTSSAGKVIAGLAESTDSLQPGDDLKSHLLAECLYTGIGSGPNALSEKHCLYMRFYITVSSTAHMFLGYLCSAAVSRHDRTRVGFIMFTLHNVYAVDPDFPWPAQLRSRAYMVREHGTVCRLHFDHQDLAFTHSSSRLICSSTNPVLAAAVSYATVRRRCDFLAISAPSTNTKTELN